MSSNSTDLYILDTGHGSSAVLVSSGFTAVFDAGPGNALLEFLHQNEIARVDSVLISHAHADHLGGLIALLASDIPVTSVKLNGDCSVNTDLWNDVNYIIKRRLREGTIDYQVGLNSREPNIQLPDGTDISIVAPETTLTARAIGGTDEKGRKITSHTLSVVVRIGRAGEGAVLLPGDLDDVGLANLADDGKDITSKVLCYPHHGGHSATSKQRSMSFVQQLCEMVAPETMIFSVGRNSQFKNPRPEIVNKVKELLPECHIGCTQLSKSCAAEVPMSVPSHLWSGYAHGKASNSCCIGTVRVKIAPKFEVMPTRIFHEKFVSLNAPNALCASTKQKKPRATLSSCTGVQN